jgi:uncharacterized protein YdeI (YjbR/CyaY-like superfamily)
MAHKFISDGTVHKLPLDFKKALMANKTTLVAWEDLTPLARNEWICWVIFVKQEKTRQDHIKRAVAELQAGKRRPCCWLGCIHRKDKPISPSVRAVINRR